MKKTKCLISIFVLTWLITSKVRLVVSFAPNPIPILVVSSSSRRHHQPALSSSRLLRTTVVTLNERPWELLDTTENKNSNNGSSRFLNNDDDDSIDHSLIQGSVGQATQRLGKTGPTVWTEFAKLAQQNTNVVNLGQGFPDWLPPQFCIDCLVEAALDTAQSPHQYTRTAGHPSLVAQLARRYSAHLHKNIDSMTQVAVTVGASQALYLSLQTLIAPGDEVVLFEPFFDLYVNQIKLAGGVPVYCPLTFEPYENEENENGDITGGSWVLNAEALNKAVNVNTKAIILNSPHNPTGKIFTREEMEMVATALELAHPDCVVLSDEVYKYIVHSPPKLQRPAEESLFCRGHVHFASLPGMWERTITISSAGKTFSATGWQVGWCIGPERLIARIHQLLPYVQFCASTVVQEALARSLPRADEPYQGHASYYDYLRVKYTRKRDLLAAALKEAGFGVPDYNRTPGGGFFILARIGHEMRDGIPASRLLAGPDTPMAALAPKSSRSDSDINGASRRVRQDWALCQWLAEEKDLLILPGGPFFSDQASSSTSSSSIIDDDGISQQFVRVAFCKEDDTIEAAAMALQKLKMQQECIEEATSSVAVAADAEEEESLIPMNKY
jgi:kynurenine---oxoglutarate transaminase / cysteine-S-conjugate beta-lyase / glutamine---phenylpyruvate transaminase